MKKSFLLLFFLLLVSIFTFNVSTSAYHLIFLVHDLVKTGTSKCVRICHGHGKKQFGTLYSISKYGIPKGDPDYEFFDKIHGRYITNKNKYYRQLIDLIKKTDKFDNYWRDGDGFEYSENISKAEQKKLDKYYEIQENAKKKIEEILHDISKWPI